MGSDDLFKKRKKSRQKRKYAFRSPKADSYLIVTEGTRTEPNYFNGLKEKIVESIGGMVNVVSAPEITIYGVYSCGRIITILENVNFMFGCRTGCRSVTRNLLLTIPSEGATL